MADGSPNFGALDPSDQPAPLSGEAAASSVMEKKKRGRKRKEPGEPKEEVAAEQKERKPPVAVEGASLERSARERKTVVQQQISFKDSPEWDDTEINAHIEEGVDSIHIATTMASPSLSKANSESLSSPSLPDASSTSVISRKVAGASIVWKDLTVGIKDKRKYSDKVVKSSNGYALPGTLTIIMGPARSGKSTLLRAIAGSC